MTASSYDEALKRVLVHEGGYSDHPSDPGGPTNWGITIHDARAYWRKDATAADVRNMPIDVAKDIYRSKYWDAMRCDDLPAGVDYAVFDYGVNSGIARAAKVLQRFVGANVDGEISPDTIAATAPADAAELINQICDERLAFLQSLRTWGVFGNGWGRRVREVRAAAVSMAGRAPHDVGALPPWLATMREISGTREYSGSADNPAILGWARFIGEKYPEMRGYCAQYNHDAIAWCGLTVAYCLAKNGIRPVFGKTENERFLWAGAWQKFGVRLDKPKPGCVMVFTRSGRSHVAFYEGEEGNDYLIRGGNQSDAVTLMRMHRSKLTAAMWPATPAIATPASEHAKSASPRITDTTKVGFGAAIVAAVAATAQWIGAHPILVAVAAIAAVPLILFAIRTIWRVK
jgi:uncharacterized protein (TIGR02594 family)